MCKGGARRPRAVRETGRSRRSPEGVEGRGAHGGRAQCAIEGRKAAGGARGARSARPVGEAARSKPNEVGRAASELASDAERPYRIVEHAQRASAAPEHRAAVREAKGRLGPGNLEGEARKYAGPYPRAAQGECAGETGKSGAKTRNTGPLKASTVRRRGLTMPHCGTLAALAD